MGLSALKVLMRIIGGADRFGPEGTNAPGDPRAAVPPVGLGRLPDPPRPRRRRKRRYLIVPVLLLLVAIGFAVPYVGQAVFSPWAFSLTGSPTLTGYWFGEVAFAPGDTRRVALKVHSNPPTDHCRGCSPIDGAVRACTGGRPATYRLTGDVQGRHARRFSLSVTPGEPPGRYLRWLKGEWPGGDQIAVTATLVVRDADHAIRSEHQPPGPVAFTMRRATKARFNAPC